MISTKSVKYVGIDEHALAQDEWDGDIIVSFPKQKTLGEPQRYFLSRHGARELYESLGKALGMEQGQAERFKVVYPTPGGIVYLPDSAANE